MSNGAGPPTGAEPEVLGYGADPRRSAGWRRHRVGAEVVIAALLVGAAVGYVVGHHHRAAVLVATTPSNQPVAPLLSSPVTATGNTCAQQIGRRLQLGVEVSNPSAAKVTLDRLVATLPLGQLRAGPTALGTCGQVSEPAPITHSTLAAGANAWVTMTLRVLVGCPAPAPVQFTLHYREAGHAKVEPLDEFPDLGRVPYSGCPPVRSDFGPVSGR